MFVELTEYSVYYLRDLTAHEMMGICNSALQFTNESLAFSTKCQMRRGLPCCSAFVRFASIFAMCVLLGGCLSRSRPVSQRYSTAPLLTATSSDLIERINAQASRIHTLKGTIKLATSVGGGKSGKVTEYQEIRGYILARKPSSLRMIGLLPVLQNPIFDMVSEGDLFKLSLPTKHQFIVGISYDGKPSNSTLESLRPRAIFDALLLQEIDPADDAAFLEQTSHSILDPVSGKPLLQADYTLYILRRNGHGWYLARKISFDRTDLRPYRQISYDESGSIATDTHYGDYEDFDGSALPATIQIWCPQQEYSVSLRMVKLTVNESLPEDKFVLEPPPGVRVMSR